MTKRVDDARLGKQYREAQCSLRKMSVTLHCSSYPFYQHETLYSPKTSLVEVHASENRNPTLSDHRPRPLSPATSQGVRAARHAREWHSLDGERIVAAKWSRLRRNYRRWSGFARELRFGVTLRAVRVIARAVRVIARAVRVIKYWRWIDLPGD